ncbi:MAG: hypothetical protein V3S16_14175 [Candidatus Desulfatibia sp.]|uniref:hypothetical protein n=1 Tax=Candidatus Desulfatibia sp. TaxID=3101189 RepID=UPI002F2BC3B7
MRKLSPAAQVAKLIKSELKKNGIACKAKSSSFSMGDSVTIEINNQPPWVVDAIESQTDKYEYGTFDAMTDCQGFKNRDFDGPQTKYLTINNRFDESITLEARRHILSKIDVEHHSENDIQLMTWNYLTGSNRFLGCYFKKPLIKYAA